MNKAKNLYTIRSSTPHIFSAQDSTWIMNQVLIALMFPTAMATYLFGIRVLVMTLFSISVCVLLEYSYQKINKHKQITVSDHSAIITGLLLALSVPTTAPLWALFIGDFIAIILIKQLAGGIGYNILNPAVTARVIMKLLLSPWITNWVLPGPDVVSTATPLATIGNFSREVGNNIPSLSELFLGLNLGGPVGETSKLALLIGGFYLIWKKIINPLIPIVYILSFILVIYLYSGFNLEFTFSHVLSGTLIFAAIFMVTDYTSTPLTLKGKLIFASLCGLLTALIRLFFPLLDGGVGVAIIIMNLLVPKINKITKPRVYGYPSKTSIYDTNKKC